MMNLHKWIAGIAVATGTAIAAVSGASAQDFPSRPIQLVVGFTPGGGADISARIVAEKMGELLGQAVVVENRAGAGGNLAPSYVAKAKPDGYTLLETTIAHVIGRAAHKDLDYDILSDFAPVASMGGSNYVLAVSNDVPASNVEEFISYVKSQSGQVPYASSGTGGPTHLAGELFASTAGIGNLKHIPYKGASPAVTDLIAGRVKMLFVTIPQALPLVESGQIKALAVSGKQRSPLAPNIPTIDESGLPGFEASTWFGILAPKGTPGDVITKLASSVSSAMSDPGVLAKYKEQGFDASSMSGEAFGAFMNSEATRWADVVNRIGLTGE